VRDVHAARGFAVTIDSTTRGPASLVARAELHFLEGPLAGLALRGFSVWRAGDGAFVTLPRLSSSLPFLRPSRLAKPGLAETTLREIQAAILAAHSKR
jgi:hypothetical protein